MAGGRLSEEPSLGADLRGASSLAWGQLRSFLLPPRLPNALLVDPLSVTKISPAPEVSPPLRS